MGGGIVDGQEVNVDLAKKSVVFGQETYDLGGKYAIFPKETYQV
jgi:hypothetical protein